MHTFLDHCKQFLCSSVTGIIFPFAPPWVGLAQKHQTPESIYSWREKPAFVATEGHFQPKLYYRLNHLNSLLFGRRIAVYPELRYQPGQISPPVWPALLLVHIIHADHKLLRAPNMILTTSSLQPMQPTQGSSALHQSPSSTEPNHCFFLFRETKFIPFNQEVPEDNLKGGCC